MAFELENGELRVFFLPFFAAGHMIPMVDIARLMAIHGGADVTILTTAANAAIFQSSIDRDTKAGHRIRTHLLPFPSSQLGLPDGIENLNAAVSGHMMSQIFQAIALLKEPIEELLHQARPDCIISDTFYAWTTGVALQLGIPGLVFHASSYFQSCAASAAIVTGKNDVVSLQDLPHKVEFLKSQMPDWSGISSFMEAMEDSNKKTYGAIMNSFTELESDYEDHYRNKVGSKTWSLGPVSLWANKDFSDKTERGNSINNVNYQDLINWLDSKEENSVLYVSFGSLTRFATAQLVEIAHGLEASGHQFIWAIKTKETQEEEEEEEDRKGALFLESFEERMKRSQQGLLLRKWAPQLLILEHPAVGATVTHCGWNSILECVTAGLPMVTWPLFADQFYNEKLLTDVVRIGVGVGVERWILDWWRLSEETEAAVGREKLEKAVRFVMSGEEEEALEMRRRAKKLSVAAKMAVESGGSSWSNLVALVDELKSLKIQP